MLSYKFYKMQINRKNYEIFFLDYFENSLTEPDREALARFLELNPDLQDEFFSFEQIRVIPDKTINYNLKAGLKRPEILPYKNITEENFESWIIAHFEGDLSMEEEEVFNEFVRLNQGLESEIELYRLTFLTPDTSLNFQGKKYLKKKNVLAFPRQVLWYAASVAAVLLIAFGLFTLNDSVNIDRSGQRVTVVKPELKMDKVDQPADGKKIEVEVPFPVHETVSQPVRLVMSSKDSKSTMSDQMTRSDSNVLPMPALAFSGRLTTELSSGIDLNLRDEITAAFDDMILRDGLQPVKTKSTGDKSLVGRIVQNIGSKLFGTSHTSGQPAIIEELAIKGKETLYEIAKGILPIETDEAEKQKKTVFAMGENFSVSVTKSKNMTGTEMPEN